LILKDFGSDPHGASIDVSSAGGFDPPAQSIIRGSAPLTAKRTTRVSRAKTVKSPARNASAKEASAKKAPAKKTAASKSAKTRPPEASQKLLDVVLKSLDRDKAEDVIAIDMSNKSPMADYIVIASGRSNRHVAAIAEHLREDLKKHGVGGRAEGLPAGDWALIDALDIIVHVFRPEVRAFYNLEKMWGESALVAEAV
jgi:ribosome-associated protein